MTKVYIIRNWNEVLREAYTTREAAEKRRAEREYDDVMGGGHGGWHVVELTMMEKEDN